MLSTVCTSHNTAAPVISCYVVLASVSLWRKINLGNLQDYDDMSACVVDVTGYIVYALAAFLVRINNIVPVKSQPLPHNMAIIQMGRAA